MFGNTTYPDLQQYWFILISLLGGLLVFFFSIQGGCNFSFGPEKTAGERPGSTAGEKKGNTIGERTEKTAGERTLPGNGPGGKGLFTLAMLVAFAGTFFASFPLFYATSFGGAYWLWMLILFAFVIRALACEIRRVAGSLPVKMICEGSLFVGSMAGTVLVGVVLATFFSGSPFSLSEMNSVVWGDSGRGLEAVLSVFNLSLGLAFFFLARVIGLQYFVRTSDYDYTIPHSRKQLLYNAIPFLFFFLVFFIWLMLREGYAVDPDTGEVFMESRKYLHNLLEMTPVLVIFLTGMTGVLGGIILSLLRSSSFGIWLTGPGTVLMVFSLFMLAGFNHTAFYPSSTDLQSSLTIGNASSSRYTLEVLSYGSLFLPVVIVYGAIAWRVMNKKPHMTDL
ncbi:MAG: cytochrome d ubiquinol oxidase subunit II [Bacteroidales bacterium]